MNIVRYALFRNTESTGIRSSFEHYAKKYLIGQLLNLCVAIVMYNKQDMPY